MGRFIKDNKKYYGYSVRAAKSMLNSEVANSHLNWLWWILDPLLFMLVYAFVAKVVFDKSELYLEAFIFIGLSTWDFFSKTVKQSVKLVTNNKAIVSKVYLPKFILIYSQMMVNFFKMLVALSLVVIVMIAYRVPVSYRLIYILPLFILLILVTFGVSTLCLHFGVFFEDLFNIINAVLRLVFYMSGVFYSIEKNVPEPYKTVLLRFNPIALIMDNLRNCMIYKKDPDFKWMGIWLIVSILLSILGIHTIYRNENTYVKVI